VTTVGAHNNFACLHKTMPIHQSLFMHLIPLGAEIILICDFLNERTLLLLTKGHFKRLYPLTLAIISYKGDG
jgi:hypothetical protein